MAIETSHKETTFGVGDIVRVHVLLTGKSKEEKGSRTQVFEGSVMGIRGKGEGKSFVVRRVGEAGIGIEQIFPINSPLLEKIDVVRQGKRGVRQAKIYYTRDKSNREIEKIYTRARRRNQAKEVAKTAKSKTVAKRVVKKNSSAKKISKKRK